MAVEHGAGDEVARQRRQFAGVNSPLQRQFAREVVLAMHDQRLNQVQLADRSGVAANYITRLLKGKAEGSLSTWSQLFDALGLTLVVRPVALDEAGDPADQ